MSSHERLEVVQLFIKSNPLMQQVNTHKRANIQFNAHNKLSLKNKKQNAIRCVCVRLREPRERGLVWPRVNLSWCGFHAIPSRIPFLAFIGLVLISELGIRFRLWNIYPDSITNMENYITFHSKLEIEFRFSIKTRNVPNISEIIRNT